MEDGAEENGYGVHVATVAGGVLLRHKSYVYDRGKYPFVWRVCYPRENTIWGFGEIHQLKTQEAGELICDLINERYTQERATVCWVTTTDSIIKTSPASKLKRFTFSNSRKWDNPPGNHRGGHLGIYPQNCSW